MKPYFELGTVLKPQGIRGEVKAELYTDDPERVLDLETVYFSGDGEFVPVPVKKARTDGKFAYLTFAGVMDRDEAEKLRGRIFYIDRAHAAPLPEGAYYVSDLEGLPVFCDGNRLGTLKEILQNGALDVYVVEKTDGSQLMFPAVPDVFVERNVDEGRIVLDPVRLAEVSVDDI